VANPVHFLEREWTGVDEQALSLGLHTGSMEALRLPIECWRDRTRR